MLRTLTGIGFSLVLVGAAHAQDTQVTVKLDGKSVGAVRSELYRAAQKVCTRDATALDPLDEACVAETFQQALQQFRSAPRIIDTAYRQASPAGVR